MMTYELDDIEKEALFGLPLDEERSRYGQDLSDPPDDLQLAETFPDPPRRFTIEEQHELFIDATTLAYMAIRFSGLWKQLSGKEWDEMADVMGEKVVGYLNGLVEVEITQRETEKN